MSANRDPEGNSGANEEEKNQLTGSDPDSGTPLHFGGVRHPRTPPAIPDHELLRVIGRGAYGEVWLARNIMGGYRAVKIVYRDSFDSDRPYEREFSGIQSFEPISRGHESQVDILHVGRNEALRCFYYVMELADDGSESRLQAVSRDQRASTPKPAKAGTPNEDRLKAELQTYSPKTVRSELKRRGRFPHAESLEICLALTTAVEHLHKHGLIHRDIKPANVIFVNGLPKLADIGLVTETGGTMSFVGTEGYLPPEGPGSVQADIYSLGKTLYEVATGKDRLEFPELPTLTGSPSEEEQLFELNEVLLKACHPDKDGRYRHAREMHADLLLLQAGRSVRRSRALERRLALLTRIAAGVLLVGALATGGYLSQRHQTREAKRLQQVAEDLSARMQIQNAENLFSRGDSSLALAQLARVLRDHPDNRVAAERIMAALMQRDFPRLVVKPLVHAVKFPLNPFLGTAHRKPASFSPDGQRILTITEDYSVHVWNAQTGEETIPPQRHKEEVYSAEFSPDGTKLVTASDDRTACVVDVLTGRLVFAPLQHDRAVLHATFSPDGRWIATACLDGTARVLDAETGKLVAGPLVHVGRMNTVAFSPDSQRLATGMEGGRIRVWAVKTAQELHRFRPDGPVLLVRFSPDGKWIAASIYGEHGSGIWRVQVWNAESGEPVSGPLLHQNRIYSLEFSPDSQRLVTAMYDHVARVWQVATGQELFQLRHSSLVYSAVFSPDGRQILTASVDHTARLWDGATGAAISEAMRHDGRVIHAEFSRDGSRVLTAGWEDKTVKLWDVRFKRLPPPTLPHKHWVTSGEFDAVGREVITATGGVIATATSDNKWGSGQQIVGVWDAATGETRVAPKLADGMEAVAAQFTQSGPKALISERKNQEEFSKLAQVWELRSGTPVGKALQHEEELTCAHFSADGLKLATGCEDGVVMIWDARQGVALTPSLTNQGRLKSVRFSPDATKLIAATEQGTAILWDVATAKRIAEPLRHDDAVWFAQFSPKGDKVVTASLDYTAKTWSTNGTLIATLQHSAPVEYAEFSPDGNQVATTSGNEARIWNVATGKKLTEPLQHLELVMTARFSADGLRVVTASKDRSAQLWDAKTGLKLADPFRHEGWVISASFSRDGQQAISTSLDRTARIWEVPIAPSPIPTWLPELAEAIGGQRLNSDRIPEPVTWQDIVAIKQRMEGPSATDSNARWAWRILESTNPVAPLR